MNTTKKQKVWEYLLKNRSDYSYDIDEGLNVDLSYLKNVRDIIMKELNINISMRHFKRIVAEFVKELNFEEKDAGNNFDEQTSKIGLLEKNNDNWEVDKEEDIDLDIKKDEDLYIDYYKEIKDEEEDIFDYMNLNNDTCKTIVQEEEDDDGDDWEVKIDYVECSKVIQKVDVFLSKKAHKKFKYFMRWAGRNEWFAYLIGSLKNSNDYYIDDLLLPEQNASSGNVNQINTENYNEYRIVGAVHSHHDMGIGFSGHDENFVNNNHNLSLLVANNKENGGYKIGGVARVKTPCGSFMKIKVDVKRMEEKFTEDDKKLKEEFMKKIFGNRRQHAYHDNRILKPEQFMDYRFLKRCR